MVLSLAPWDKRERSQQDIVAQLTGLLKQVPGARITSVQPNSLGIRGAGNGLQFAIVGNSYKELGDAANKIVAEMEKDRRFQQPRLSSDATQPQLAVAIDRERASDLGINITGLAEALQAMLDGHEVGQVFIEDRSYEVKLVSTTNPINDPTDLENIFLKTADGRFVPVATIASLTEVAVPPSLSREQQMRAVSITSGLAPDFALGSALTRATEIATPLLPPGARIIPLAEAATLGESNGAMLTIFGFAIVIILLVLAAQFESFVSAIIIMATVPIGLACAVFALIFTGTSLNAYSQIGLVLLVGVMAKNGILIVEFANQLRDRGMGVREAIEQASVHPASPGHDDHDLHRARRPAAGAGVRRRRRGAHRARLGDRRRARHGDGLDAVPDAGRLPAARPLRHAEGRGRKAPEARAARGRERRRAGACPCAGGIGATA